MNYSKPEITVLGNAALTIQGMKPTGVDSSIDPQHENLADCELDD